jgi:hypothetical protein
MVAHILVVTSALYTPRVSVSSKAEHLRQGSLRPLVQCARAQQRCAYLRSTSRTSLVLEFLSHVPMPT